MTSEPVIKHRPGTIRSIAKWFETAKPSATQNDLQVQIGVHFEEVAEMLDELSSSHPTTDDLIMDARVSIRTLATYLKTKDDRQIEIENEVGFLDSLCDQIVTATGVAEYRGYMIDSAMQEVDESNYSKFQDGVAVLDANGKIAKSANYFKADLTHFI